MRRLLCLFVALILIPLSACGEDGSGRDDRVAEPTTPAGFVAEEPILSGTPGEGTEPFTTPGLTVPEQIQPQPAEPQVLEMPAPKGGWHEELLDDLVQVVEYAYFDLNYDGDSELIVKVGTCEADYRYLFYGDDGGYPLYLGQEGGASSLLESDGKQLIVHCGKQGIERIAYMTLEGDEVRATQRITQDVGTGDYTWFPYYLQTYDAPAWDRRKSPVRAAFAEDVSLGSHQKYQAEESEYLVDVAFFTHENVSDFCLLRMEYTSDLEPTEGSICYSFGTLKADRQIVVGVTFPGAMPSYGVRFVDKQGKTWYFSLNLSGRDGSLEFVPFTPTKPLAGENVPKVDGLWAQYYEGVTVADFHYFVAQWSEYTEMIVLGTTEVARDFQVVKLGSTMEGLVTVDQVVWSLDALTGNKPLVLGVTFGEVMPHYAVSQLDSEGNRRYYALMQSGEDGSVILSPFTLATEEPEPAYGRCQNCEEPLTLEETQVAYGTLCTYCRACSFCGGNIDAACSNEVYEYVCAACVGDARCDVCGKGHARCVCFYCTVCGKYVGTAADSHDGMCQDCYNFENEVPNLFCGNCDYSISGSDMGVEGFVCPACGYVIVPPLEPFP